jgi:hypothetical protein
MIPNVLAVYYIRDTRHEDKRHKMKRHKIQDFEIQVPVNGNPDTYVFLSWYLCLTVLILVSNGLDANIKYYKTTIYNIK